MNSVIFMNLVWHSIHFFTLQHDRNSETVRVAFTSVVTEVRILTIILYLYCSEITTHLFWVNILRFYWPLKISYKMTPFISRLNLIYDCAIKWL